jgi:hypothetical protein
MQRALNALQMQGNSDEEDDVENITEAAEIPIPAEKQQDIDNLMKISQAAYIGSPSDSTISLLLSLSRGQAYALADTSRTNTFLD